MIFINSRGGVVTIVLACLAAGSVFTLAVLPYSSSSSPTRSSTRTVPPVEIAGVLTLAGLTPETLAAAGVSVGECEVVFDSANVYCLQADRLRELRLAIRSLNEAKAAAVRPRPGVPNPEEPSISQRQAAVDDLKNSAFQFVTSRFVASQTGKLTNMRDNQEWLLPLPYLTVDRTKPQWLALRAALSAQRLHVEDGRELTPEITQLLSDVDANPSVSDARRDLTDRLQSITDAWNTRFRR